MTFQIILFAIFLIIVVLIARYFIKKKPAQSVSNIDQLKKLLDQNVSFYRDLSAAEKIRFYNKVQQFLAKVTITGVKTNVEDIDKALIAAGAIIPIFKFKNWEYINLNEVLLYPDAFSHEYKQEGNDRQILGMVGNGPMHRVMILAKSTLRSGFTNTEDGRNTAIHEFVHLIDKSDGDVDGLPEALIPFKYSVPWIRLMHQEIAKIQDSKSKLNTYGATNEAEFLAVAAEYFFEKPDQLESKHPELYSFLQMIFEPAIDRPVGGQD